MAFDNAKYNAPAKHGDVARVALQAAIALSNLKWVLERVADRSDPKTVQDLKDAGEAIAKLDQMFDDLTGYTQE